MGAILKHEHNLLLDSIPAALIVTDLHSKILYVNRQSESFFGYKSEEIEGQRIGLLFLEEDLIYFLPNILYLALYKNGFSGEALLKRKDGKRIFIHLVSASFREEGETFVTFAFQEIQRLKNLERERAEVEHWAKLGRMVGGIAHQFRNPVASIGGYANRLRKQGASVRMGQSYINQILQETAKLESVLQRVEEYVQFSRSVFQRENIQELVKTALDHLPDQAVEKKDSIQLDMDGVVGDGQAFVDRKRLIKALIYVLENSLEAVHLNPSSQAKRPIKVALFDDGESVRIMISDRGQGIAKKDLGQIFDPFFSTRAEHAGLGLTFARRVLEEHGGKIQAESRLRQGTIVTLEFPKDRRRRVRRELLSPLAAETRDTEART